MTTKKKKRSPVPIRKDTRKKSGKTNLTLGNAPEVPDKKGPLNAEKDFDTPTKKAAAEPEAETGSLLTPEQPPAPTVVGKRILMHYLKPTFSKAKTGTRLVSMHFSLALTEKHIEGDLLPEAICESWEIINDKGRKKLDLVGIPGQRAEFYMTHDIDDVKLILPAAEMSNVSIAVIQKKGEGESITVIRLSFRLTVPVSHEVERFAVTNYGNGWWLHIEETEEALFNAEHDGE